MLAVDAPVKVFWQPGCSSCLKAKEFLSHRGVKFESINVLESPGAMAELHRLGARSVPIVAVGPAFIYAQSIEDIAAFLGLQEHARSSLAATELARRTDHFLLHAMLLTKRIPQLELERRVPRRDRSVRQLVHHVFRIPEVLLLNVDTGRLTTEMVFVEPPDDMVTVEQLLGYGESVQRRFRAWQAADLTDLAQRQVQTFYGSKSLYELLERTAWHCAQHVRQLELMLGQMAIDPPALLGAESLAGLPIPDDVWDE